MAEQKETRTVPIAEEIASLGKDPDIFSGFILDNPDPVVLKEGRGQGIKLYDAIADDAHAGSVLQTRYLTVSGERWEVEPTDESARAKEIAGLVTEALSGCNFRQAMAELLEAILYGYRPAEVIWSDEHGPVVPQVIRAKHPRRFAFTPERAPRLLTKTAQRDGEEVPEKKFLIFSYGDSDNPYGKGLARSIWWNVWFKKHGIKFWLIFLDKFSMPTPVGKYPANSNNREADKKTALEAAKAFRAETGVAIPDDFVLELVEATRGGSVSYQDMCAYMDAQISKRVLGQTLTTEVGSSGSYAASQTHNEVRQDIKEADAGALADFLNDTLIRWIVDFNFAGVAAYPKFRFLTEKEETLNELAARDEILVNQIGVQVDPEYWYDKYNLPRPKGGARVIAPQAGAEFAEAEPPNTPQRRIDALADNLLALDPLADNEERIAAAVEQANSFGEAVENILALYPDLDMAELQQTMQNGLVNSYLNGVKAVTDGD